MSPEQAVDKRQTANVDIAGELQKLARMRSSRPSADNDADNDKDSEVGTGGPFGLFQHLIATSADKVDQVIDQVIGELTQLRDHLQDETNRVHREIAGYTQTTQVALQVALQSAEAITQSLPQFRAARPHPGMETDNVALDDLAEQ